MHNSIKDLITNTHPVHRQYSSYWSFLLNSYEGGVDYSQGFINNSTNKSQAPIIQVKVAGKALTTATDSNLFKHKKERDED